MRRFNQIIKQPNHQTTKSTKSSTNQINIIMKLNFRISVGSPLNAEDCRTMVPEEHLIITFTGRRWGTRLADWIDNTDGLAGQVRCIEFEDRHDEVRIDLALTDGEPRSRQYEHLMDAISYFCLRYDLSWSLDMQRNGASG